MMNALNGTDLARHQARRWSERLGNLAAQPPASRLEGLSPQLGSPIPPASMPPRLAAIPNHLRHRHRTREDAAEELRTEEFLTGT
jgi:hypothetical protein